MLETPNLRRIWLALARTTTLFRINTGRAWLSTRGPVKKLPNGDVVVPGARPIALGFSTTNGDPVVGLSDLCGWTSIVITPAMVGSTVAVFTVIEGKRPKGGRRSKEQIQFCDTVERAGGIAGFADSPEAAIAIVDNYSKILHKQDKP